MQYIVVPFDPGTVRDSAAPAAAAKLQALITAQAAQGWEFVELSNYSTIVPGSPGCFGMGAEPAFPKTVSMAVFRK
jgi:hypothetical protein